MEADAEKANSTQFWNLKATATQKWFLQLALDIERFVESLINGQALLEKGGGGCRVRPFPFCRNLEKLLRRSGERSLNGLNAISGTYAQSKWATRQVPAPRDTNPFVRKEFLKIFINRGKMRIGLHVALVYEIEKG